MSRKYGQFAANLVWIFGTVFIGNVIPIDGGGMVPPTTDPTADIAALPLIALRLLFVFLIYQAYNSKTSRVTAIYVGIASELFLVVLNVPMYVIAITTLSVGGLYIPIPLLLLVGGLSLCKFPPFVPTPPWEKLKEYLEDSLVKS